MTTQWAAGIFSIGLLVLGASATSGQEYPNKPIRLGTGPAGGGSDFTARIVAQGISGPLGQPIIIDNRVGIILADIVSKAPPDGYTLLINGNSFWIGPLTRTMSYDVERDFLPISLLVREVTVLALHPSVPAKSIKELIELARAKPGTLNYSASGQGAISHLSAELFKSMAGVNITHVLYKGAAPALAALLSGEVQLSIADVGVVAPHAKTGKLRALAVTGTEPSVLAPGLPTIAASGLPGFEAVSMTGMFAPAKTPQAIIKRLNQEVVRVFSQPDVKAKYFNVGVEAVGSSSEEFAALVRSDTARWRKVIKDAGIKLD